MKKLFVLLIVSLFLSLSFIPSYADPIKESDHTFSYVTQILSNELFPEIEEFAKENFDPSLSNQNLFAADILKIIKKYVVERKIFFSMPPMVRVFIMQNNINKVFILEVKMIIYDGDESIPGARFGILIGKRFMIKMLDKTKPIVGT